MSYDVSLTPREVLLGTLDLGVDYFKGDSGVYVGDVPPADEQVNVWVEPVAEEINYLATEEYVNKTIEEKGYMTEEQVRALIREIVGEG